MHWARKGSQESTSPFRTFQKKGKSCSRGARRFVRDREVTEANADADTVLAAERWIIECNDANGGTVSFSTANVFVNQTNVAYRADVTLGLALGTNVEGDWSVTTASDTTNYAIADLVASVAASSTQPADVELDLTVTFENTNSSLLADGNYECVVTGTVTAN